MLLVPFGRDTPAENKATELDSELNSILKKRNISKDEKIKLYNQVLSRLLTINENIRNHNLNKFETIKDPLESKYSEHDDNAQEKFRKPETRENLNNSNAYIDESDYIYDDEFLTAENASQGTTRTFSVEDMERINNSIMQKSPSFDLIEENNEDQNKLLKPFKKNPMQLTDKKAQLIKKKSPMIKSLLIGLHFKWLKSICVLIVVLI